MARRRSPLASEVPTPPSPSSSSEEDNRRGILYRKGLLDRAADTIMNCGNIDHMHGGKPTWSWELVGEMLGTFRSFDGENFTQGEMKQLARQLAFKRYEDEIEEADPLQVTFARLKWLAALRDTSFQITV